MWFGIGGSFAVIPGPTVVSSARWYSAHSGAWGEPLAPLKALAGTLVRGRARRNQGTGPGIYGRDRPSSAATLKANALPCTNPAVCGPPPGRTPIRRDPSRAAVRFLLLIGLR